MTFSPGSMNAPGQMNSMAENAAVWTDLKAKLDAMGIDNLIQNQSQNVVNGPMQAALQARPHGTMGGAPIPAALGGMGNVASAGQQRPGQIAQSMWGLMSSPSSPYYGGGGAAV